MGGGGEEDEALRLVGMVEREGGGDRAAEGMADDDGRADAEPVHQAGDQCGLLALFLMAVAAARPAVAGPVEEEHFGPAFEQRPQRHHLVVQIGACAVDEDDGRKVGAFRRRDVDVVQGDAVDVGKAAGGRVAPLDQPGVHPRDAGKDQKQRKQESRARRRRGS